MDKDKQIQKIPKLSLEKLSEDSKLVKRGLKDLSVWPRIEELFSKLRLAYKNEKIEECIKIAEEILRIDSNHFFTLCYYGRCLYLLGKYKEALKVFNRCLKEEKNYYFLWYFRGDTYYKLGRYQKAMDDYREALDLELEEFWYRTAGNEKGLSNPNKIPESIDLLDSFMDYWDVTDEVSLFKKAFCYFVFPGPDEIQNNRKIVKYLKLVLKSNPDNEVARKLFVAASEQLVDKVVGQDNKTALVYINDALTYDPENSRLMAKKAILYEGLGNKKRAIEWINKAKEKDPTDDELNDIYEKIVGGSK